MLTTLLAIILATEPQIGTCDPVDGPPIRWSAEQRDEVRSRVRAACRASKAAPMTCAWLDAVGERESSWSPSVRHVRGRNERGLGALRRRSGGVHRRPGNAPGAGHRGRGFRQPAWTPRSLGGIQSGPLGHAGSQPREAGGGGLMARRYRAGQRLPDRDPTPPENDEPAQDRNPEIDEDQLAGLQVDADGRGWMPDRLGLLKELGPEGKADVRWLWDHEPDLRPSFAVEPPASWACEP
jgi:hypothetical protein